MENIILQLFDSISKGGSVAIVGLLFLFILSQAAAIVFLLKDRARLLAALYVRFDKSEEQYANILDKNYESLNEVVKSLTEIRIVLAGMQK